MKQLLLTLALLLATLSVSAQEPGRVLVDRDSVHHDSGFTIPDSLQALSPWKPDFRAMTPTRVKPAVSMTSVVVVHQENLPSRVTVINNNTLRLGRHFNLGNGQAWNNGSFPNSYLDARTLSFPGGR